MDVKKIVSQSKFAQVGFVVNHIEKAKKEVESTTTTFLNKK